MPRTLILIVSVALNVLLGGWLWATAQRPNAVAQVSNPVPARPAEAPRVEQTAWGELNLASQDSEYVAKLRDLGYPAWAIRRLVLNRLRERNKDRLHPRGGKDEVVPYWQSEAYDAKKSIDPQTRAAIRRASRDIEEQVRALVGPLADEAPWEAAVDRQRFGDLAPAKVKELKMIKNDYAELAMEIRAGAEGVLLAEDRQKLALLDREERADIECLLSPEELDQLDRRTSAAAHAVRNRLSYLDPSEEEFLKMYRVQQAFDAHYGTGNLSGVDEDRRRDAQVQLKAQFREVLGPERFEQYEITTDGNFPGTFEVVTERKLPRTLAWELVKLQRDAVKRARGIKEQSALSTQERAQALEALRRETTRQLQESLGDEGLERYRSRAGSWLGQLSTK